jgi:hypothetical protein
MRHSTINNIKPEITKSNRLFPAFVLLTILFLLGILSLQSCKKNCPAGKEGENCEDPAITKFLGIWEGTNTCEFINQINISLNGPIDSQKVALTGLISNQLFPIVGRANYASLVFESNQNLSDGIILTTCSGNLNPDGTIKLYFSYVDETVIPTVSKSCSFTGKLQSSNTGENFPVITTNSLTILSDSSVSSGGFISYDGGSPVTKRGVVWGESPSPIANQNSLFKTQDGTGPGNFQSVILGLEAGKTYYIRAYATNAAGTSYGNEIKFTKPECQQDGQICVGQMYQNEGIVAYFLKPGDVGYDPAVPHGLLILDYDLGNYEWGCFGSSVGNTSSDLGTGESNTSSIVSSCSEDNIAAKICSNLGTGWYLPSKAELIKVYQNLTSNGLGGLSAQKYWTSSEDPGNNAINAWAIDFSNNTPELFSKYNKASVRAVKNF